MTVILIHKCFRIHRNRTQNECFLIHVLINGNYFNLFLRNMILLYLSIAQYCILFTGYNLSSQQSNRLWITSFWGNTGIIPCLCASSDNVTAVCSGWFLTTGKHHNRKNNDKTSRNIIHQNSLSHPWFFALPFTVKELITVDKWSRRIPKNSFTFPDVRQWEAPSRRSWQWYLCSCNSLYCRHLLCFFCFRHWLCQEIIISRFLFRKCL